MIGTIVKKPRITVLTELPMLAMAVNAPIHLEKEVISLNNKEHMSMKVPLLLILLIKIKQHLNLKEKAKNEKRINTDGLCT